MSKGNLSKVDLKHVVKYVEMNIDEWICNQLEQSITFNGLKPLNKE